MIAAKDPVPGLFYGELVITSPRENQPTVQADLESIKAQTQSMIEVAAYYLAKQAGCDPEDELDGWF